MAGLEIEVDDVNQLTVETRTGALEVILPTAQPGLSVTLLFRRQQPGSYGTSSGRRSKHWKQISKERRRQALDTETKQSFHGMAPVL